MYEEDDKLQDALTKIAFKEDHNKTTRLLQMRAALAAARIRGDVAPTGSGNWANTKRYRTRTQPAKTAAKQRP
jgi:hypothetical protein